MAETHPPSQHSHKHHREMHVGHRRAKYLLKSGGHGGLEHGKHLVSQAEKLTKSMREHEAEERHEGYKAGGRLDKRARGGAVKKFQMGGGIGVKPVRKFTPAKHKPHMNVNIVNLHRPGGGGMGRGIPRVAPPGVPPVGAGMPTAMPPMKRGGRAQKKQLGGPAVIARPP